MSDPADFCPDGKWVTDDYDEEEALVKCAENNFTPYGMAHEEEITANAISTLNPPGRPSTATAGLGVEAAYFASRQNVSFTPFYTLGGPTTHFGGHGLDPFSGAGWGNKRARMRTIGTDEENWMLKLAEESRMMDARLREFRQERLVELEGEDATRGWVYALERTTEEDVNDGRGNLDALRMPGLQPPTMERKRSGLSREVSLPFKGLDDGEDDALTPLPQEAGDDDAMAGSEGGLDQSAIKDYTTPGGRIIVQSEQEAIRDQSRYNWGLGSWTAGTIKAAYEVGPSPSGQIADTRIASYSDAAYPAVYPTPTVDSGADIRVSRPELVVRFIKAELCSEHSHWSRGTRTC